MSFIGKFIASLIANAVALFAAAYFLHGFQVSGGALGFAKLAIILTILNFILKPILKLIFSPVIFLTLGLGLIVVNAIVLYLLEHFSTGLLMVTDVATLVIAAIIIGIINTAFHSVT